MYRKLSLVCVVVTLCALLPLSGLAQPAAGVGSMSGATPGKRFEVKPVEVTASVEAVDAATRTVTLKGPEGRLLTVEAGQQVKNFDRIRVGDHVVARYQQAVSVELKKGGTAPVARVEGSMGGTAKPGTKPAAGVGHQISATADVIGVDPKTRTVTLRGPQRTIDVVVHDPEQFKLVAVGDQVEAPYTEAVAVSVQPVAPRK